MCVLNNPFFKQRVQLVVATQYIEENEIQTRDGKNQTLSE